MCDGHGGSGAGGNGGRGDGYEDSEMQAIPLRLSWTVKMW